MNTNFSKPLAPLVLPAVYDDVLSYEEYLSKVIYQLNELTKYINDTMDNLYDNIDSYVDSGVASRMQEITDKINALTVELEEKTSDLQIQVNNKADFSYVDNKISSITNDLSELQTEIMNAIEECKEYCDHNTDGISERIDRVDAKITLEMQLEFANVNARIDNIIKEYPKLYDPATGFTEVMQDVIFNTYKALRVMAITAIKYDDQQLTAEEYDSMNIRAIKYDVEMFRLLFSDLREMFNPFTGKEESVRDVLDYLIRMLKWNAKTTGEYDGYEYTASEFDASSFNAYEQDTNQYITATTPDLKNKAYKNYELIDTEMTSGDSFLLANDMNSIQFEYEDIIYTLPYVEDAHIIISGLDVTMDERIVTLNSGTIKNVFGITDVKDVTELDK